MKNVHKKVLSFVSSRRFRNNPFISRMFQPLGQNQTFTVHARQMMHMLFETCAREKLNKLEIYVHAAGGKRFKFEDNPSFFSLSRCSTTVVVWDRNLYLEEATKQLSDTHFYQQIDRDVTETYQKEITSVVTQAITTGDLPPEARNLIVDHPRTSKFYMLPKIHKPGNPGRPIVSACNCPTSNISAYLDSVMAPLIKQLPTYVKDSSHALQILESFYFTGSHRYLFTMDIKSLYTVVLNNDGLQALKYHLDLRPEQQPPTLLFDWLNLSLT